MVELINEFVEKKTRWKEKKILWGGSQWEKKHQACKMQLNKGEIKEQVFQKVKVENKVNHPTFPLSHPWANRHTHTHTHMTHEDVYIYIYIYTHTLKERHIHIFKYIHITYTPRGQYKNKAKKNKTKKTDL